LFKFNNAIRRIEDMFSHNKSLTKVPDGIIEKVKELKANQANISSMFYACTSASNYSSLPWYMK